MSARSGPRYVGKSYSSDRLTDIPLLPLQPKGNRKKGVARGSSFRMPNFFKRSSSETGILSEQNRKVLHACRMVLIRELDVNSVLDYLCQSDENGFRADVRETILSPQLNKEQRVALLLDKIELKGDKTFLLFMEALKEYQKNLHQRLDDVFLRVEEGERSAEGKDERKEARLSMDGESVRKLLRRSVLRKVEHSHGSESVEELEYLIQEKVEEDSYIDCYAIPNRGRLTRAKWLESVAPLKNAPREDEGDTTTMAHIKKDLLFKKIDFCDIPAGVGLPSRQCSVFVIDKDNKYGVVKRDFLKSVDEAATVDHKQAFSKAAKLDILPENSPPPPPARRSPTVSKPPPLPPKPNNLPPLSLNLGIQTFRSRINTPRDLKPSSSSPILKEPPPLPSTEEDIHPPPRSTSLNDGQGDQQVEVLDTSQAAAPSTETKNGKDHTLEVQGGSQHSSPTGSLGSKKSSPSPTATPPLPPRQYGLQSPKSPSEQDKMVSRPLPSMSPPDPSGLLETDLDQLPSPSWEEVRALKAEPEDSLEDTAENTVDDTEAVPTTVEDATVGDTSNGEDVQDGTEDTSQAEDKVEEDDKLLYISSTMSQESSSTLKEDEDKEVDDLDKLVCRDETSDSEADFDPYSKETDDIFKVSV